MQIQIGGFLAGHSAVLAKIERQLAGYGRFILLQLIPLEQPVQIILYGCLADAIGQMADGRPHIHPHQGVGDYGQLAVAQQRLRGIPQIAQGRRTAAVQRSQRLRQPHRLDHLGGRAVCPAAAQIARHCRQIEMCQLLRPSGRHRLPHHLKVLRRSIPRPVA
ncbi:hypothetical protein D3C73_723630 [compost metagenome]